MLYDEKHKIQNKYELYCIIKGKDIEIEKLHLLNMSLHEDIKLDFDELSIFSFGENNSCFLPTAG